MTKKSLKLVALLLVAVLAIVSLSACAKAACMVSMSSPEPVMVLL